MSTFIFNLNDTTALNDSVVAQVIKLSEACKPVMTEAETNGLDVWIVFIICIAIVLVALIAGWALLSWKSAEIKAANNNSEDKNEEEGFVNNKQKADALNKLLDYLARNTYTEEYDENAGKMVKKEKGLDSNEADYYIKVLRAVMKGESTPDLKKQADEKAKP